MPFLFLKHVNRSPGRQWELFVMFALCIFVETFITYMYIKKRSIYFCKPWLLHWGKLSLRRLVFLYKKIIRACCAQRSSGESGLCCIYGLLFRDGYRFLNHCIECFYSLNVLL